MDVSELVKKYLKQGRMMQVASVAGSQPWICTVYYAEDDEHNLYWLSLPDRRHSKEIAVNSKVAIAVPIKYDAPVIGLQAEGEAREVNEPEIIKEVMKTYTERYNGGKSFYSNFVAGKNQHKLYRFTPKFYVLFDEVNFSEETSRREWRVK